MAPTPPILLLTRPEAASRRFLAALSEEGVTGFTPVISPLIGIEITGPLPDLAGVRGAIFTSANGVRAYAQLGGGVLPLCYTVGEATALAARDAGFAPQSADGTADALVEMIEKAAPEGPLMHLHGTHARGDVAGRLTRAGIETRDAVIYDQPAQELSAGAKAALDGDVPVILPLFSPRSAAQFARAPQGRAPLFVAAMSGDVSAALEALYVTRLEIPARPDAAQMRSVVIGLLRDCGALVEGRRSVEG
ncbi:uroporphyrinogen-III synthase [Salipiger sp. P9]|uniref:uroporphyrinogen-III synthase n=1 Tax=Salipiger pentaromativorans TaxID=2943193 RepID=UPI00215855E1|nr:uroporphyrinogen-III synthase [Salipiger pentaromativorans]MCR8549618.1 uroporphyrinogen-III synthase [Salipiger pentaromativorans]